MISLGISPMKWTSDEVQEKGGYSYLSKPLNYDTMMKTLKDIFEKRKEP